VLLFDRRQSSENQFKITDVDLWALTEKTVTGSLIELIQPASPKPEAEYWQVELELGNGMTLRLRTI